MSDPIHFISLGAGVQSSVLALMAARGEIGPMPVAAVFADTGDEPASVYNWLAWLETQLPFPVYRVQKGILGVDALKVVRSKKSGNLYMKGLIPAFVKSTEEAHTVLKDVTAAFGEVTNVIEVDVPAKDRIALLGRKCTSSYKIEPILSKFRELVKPQLLEWRRRMVTFKRLQKKGQSIGFPLTFTKPPGPIVQQWIGITTDEAHRMKRSRHAWLESRWPLIEKNMSREDCLQWMRDNGYPEPPRSACRYCPFHSDEEWARQKRDEPEEFAKSVQFEKDMQAAARSQTALKGVPWLTRRCVPLESIEFVSEPGKQQVSMFGNECEGLCGV